MPDFEWGYAEVEADWADEDLVDAYYVEGWKYENDPGPDATPNPYRHGPLQSSDEVLEWLHHEGPFVPPEPGKDDNWGASLGGFRLLIFDRTKFYPLALAIDKRSTLAVETAFELVPETLPILSTAEGSQRYRFQRKGSDKAKSLQLVIQSNQILKVANFMISVSFNFETKWTTAIACIENEDSDDPYIKRIQHVLGATNMNRGLWAHPTFLPTIFARHYGDEMRESRAILRGDVTHINKRLGVSTARSFRPEGLPDDWPESLDFRWLITNTYARRVEVMQVREGCKWSCKSLKFLRDLEVEVGKEGILNWDCSHNMQKVLEYHLSVLEGTEGRFSTLQEESEASTNMLFNAITQRDSIIAQRYNDIQKKIATSTKEDSISMTTFTFITALFLPGTFISTFLSLTMIDWQPEFLTASSSGSGSGATAADGSIQVTTTDAPGTQISQFYWVFWAIDIPLTFIVLTGWYLWFRRAKKTWIRDNNIILDPRGERDSLNLSGKRGRSRSPGSLSYSSGPSVRQVNRRERIYSIGSSYYSGDSGSQKGKRGGRWGMGLIRAFWEGVKEGYNNKVRRKGAKDDDDSYDERRRDRRRSRSSSPSIIIRRGGKSRRSAPYYPPPAPQPWDDTLGNGNEKLGNEIILPRRSADTLSIRSGSRVHTINSKDGDPIPQVVLNDPAPAPDAASDPAPGDGLKRRSTSNLEKHQHSQPHHHHATKGKDKNKDEKQKLEIDDENDNEGDSFGGGDIVPWNIKKPKRTATWATDEDREKDKDDFEAVGKEAQKKRERDQKRFGPAATAGNSASRPVIDNKKLTPFERKQIQRERRRLQQEEKDRKFYEEQGRMYLQGVADLKKKEQQESQQSGREKEKEEAKAGRNATAVGGAEREEDDIKEMAIMKAKMEDELEEKEREKLENEDAVEDSEGTAGRPLAGLRDRLATARRASLFGTEEKTGGGGGLEDREPDLEKGVVDGATETEGHLDVDGEAERRSVRSARSGKSRRSEKSERSQRSGRSRKSMEP